MHQPQKTGLENPPHRARLRGIANAAGAPPRTFSDIRKMPLVLGAHDSEKPIAEQPGAQNHILANQQKSKNGLHGKILDIQPAIKRGKPASIPIKTPTVTIEPLHLPKQTKSKVLIRQVAQSSYKAYPKHRRPLKHIIVTSIVVFVFLSGLAGLSVSLKTAQNVNAQAKKIAQQTASATSAVKGVASEDNSPEALAAYKVANDMPRLLIIDKMGVNARISQIDADQKEPFAAPESIFDAGLYNPNVKPGEPGVMVLTGLVYGPAKPGIFNNLGNMQVGDNIKIERGDGKQFTYTVKAVDIYENDKVDKNKVLTPIQLGKPGLNLISSSSRFNVRTNRFEKRVAVFAAQD